MRAPVRACLTTERTKRIDVGDGPRPPRKEAERLAASAKINLQWRQTTLSRLDSANDVDQRADVGDGAGTWTGTGTGTGTGGPALRSCASLRRSASPARAAGLCDGDGRLRHGPPGGRRDRPVIKHVASGCNLSLSVSHDQYSR